MDEANPNPYSAGDTHPSDIDWTDASVQAAYQEGFRAGYARAQQTSWTESTSSGAQSAPQAQEGFNSAPGGQGKQGFAQSAGSAASYSPVQPHYAAPTSSRDHVAAGLLAIFLGCFGVHKFYLGYNTQGFIMLAVSLVGGLFSFGLVTGVIWVIALIEGVIYLTKSQSDFERIYVQGSREWF